jgi:protein SCO1/2
MATTLAGALAFSVLGFTAAPSRAEASNPSIKVGQKVPNFALTDQFGKTIELQSLKGKVVLVTFLYTQCPFPEKCPMLAEKLSKTRDIMDTIDGAKTKFHVLSITLDPKKDTPEYLRQYAQGNDRAEPNWSFLTGKPADIAKVAALFGMVYWTEKNGVIEHNMRTALIGSDGKLAKLVNGNDWKPGEMAAYVRDLINK